MMRKGDRVKVIRGNQRGQEGSVLSVDRQKDRVVVQGVNLRKKHRRPSQQDPEGGIVSFEAPIHRSNVMLVDPATNEPTRVRARRNDDGSKDLVSVRSGKVIPRG
ncbi:MAG: 50S ribosomal protein L24 [Longimicrobiaceae bacterium]